MILMKKFLTALICIALMLSLCACGESSRVLKYAEDCLEGIEMNSRLQEVYVMKYTSRKALADTVLDTDMYMEIPERGYAVIYHAYVTGGEPFSDTYAFFLRENGRVALPFDYEESNDLYKKYYSQFSPYNIAAGEMALMHLSNCNYISGMVNYAGESDEELKAKLEPNVWYSLSEKQIKKIR